MSVVFRHEERNLTWCRKSAYFIKKESRPPLPSFFGIQSSIYCFSHEAVFQNRRAVFGACTLWGNKRENGQITVFFRPEERNLTWCRKRASRIQKRTHLPNYTFNFICTLHTVIHEERNLFWCRKSALRMQKRAHLPKKSCFSLRREISHLVPKSARRLHKRVLLPNYSCFSLRRE